jgi:hypothetical protein
MQIKLGTNGVLAARGLIRIILFKSDLLGFVLYAYGLFWNICAMAATIGVRLSEPLPRYLSQIILSFSDAPVLHRWVRSFSNGSF